MAGLRAGFLVGWLLHVVPVSGVFWLEPMGETIDRAGFRNDPGTANIRPLALSEDMRAFVQRFCPSDRGPLRRLRALIDAVFGADGLGFTYGDDGTLTARQAFEQRRGNCVSFSFMFAALARHAGLDARFQEVNDGGPKRGNPKVFNRHMNVSVLIKGMEIEVDFKPYAEKAYLNRRVVSDSVALAHFYNNKGSEWLQINRLDVAEPQLEEALRLAPDFAPAWCNLGVLRLRLNDRVGAESAFRKAVALDPQLPSAARNLAALCFDNGYFDEADRLFRSAVQNGRKNPYKLYLSALEDLSRGKWRSAEKRLENAIRLAPTHGGFYRALAEVYEAQGKTAAVALCLARADIFRIRTRLAEDPKSGTNRDRPPRERETEKAWRPTKTSPMEM